MAPGEAISEGAEAGQAPPGATGAPREGSGPHAPTGGGREGSRSQREAPGAAMQGHAGGPAPGEAIGSPIREGERSACTRSGGLRGGSGRGPGRAQ